MYDSSIFLALYSTSSISNTVHPPFDGAQNHRAFTANLCGVGPNSSKVLLGVPRYVWDLLQATKALRKPKCARSQASRRESVVASAA